MAERSPDSHPARAILDAVVQPIGALLAGKASVTLLPAGGGWGRPRLVVEPTNPSARDILIWDDNGTLAVIAGDRSFFYVDEADPSAIRDGILDIVTKVAGGHLVERTVGRIHLGSSLSEPDGVKNRFIKRTQWPPY